ncbi:MAG: alpha/beta hydrolase [Rhizobiaceae bacterium]|nr:alpha/beta hydrolase [Rhizobiaceae bacterium]
MMSSASLSARVLSVPFVAFALAAGLASAAAEGLAPFKDQLFAYPKTLRESDGGAYRVVDYQEMRDINGRDEIPERRVRAEYVSLGVRRQQSDRILDTGAGKVPHIAVGTDKGARFITVYIHGQGGNRKQGVNDFTFGGNFNRIKNLMADNGGLYLSVDFADFGPAGNAQVAAVIAHYAAASPRAPVFVACGSMGGAHCWMLAERDDMAARLGGLLLLGSHWNDAFIKSPAFKAKVPVFFGQGSRDPVFPVEKQEAFFRSILKRDPRYPAMFVRFESGSHGTPIRMSDWRETINWMLSR